MNMALYCLWTVHAVISVDGKWLGKFLIYAGDHDIGYKDSMKVWKNGNSYLTELKELIGLAFPGSKITHTMMHGQSSYHGTAGGENLHLKDFIE